MLYPNLQARCDAIGRTPRLNLKRSVHFFSIPEVQIAMKAIHFRVQVQPCVSKRGSCAYEKNLNNCHYAIETKSALVRARKLIRSLGCLDEQPKIHTMYRKHTMFSSNLQARCDAIGRTPSLNLKRSAHFLSIPEVQIAMKAIHFRVQVQPCVSKLIQIAIAQQPDNHYHSQAAQTAQTFILSAGVER